MSAPQLERFFLIQIDPEAGETKDLSNDWQKYARGERLPRETKIRKGREVLGAIPLADAAFPGSARWIRSPLWKVLKLNKLSVDEGIELMQAVPSTIQSLFEINSRSSDGDGAPRLEITLENWQYLSRVASIDALGAMMIYMRSVAWRKRYAPNLGVSECRSWLHYAHGHFETVRIHRDTVVEVLSHWAPELGDLSFLGVGRPEHDLVADIFGSSFGDLY